MVIAHDLAAQHAHPRQGEARLAIARAEGGELLQPGDQVAPRRRQGERAVQRQGRPGHALSPALAGDVLG